MKNDPKSDPLMILLNLLEDEFRDLEEVRIRPHFRAKIRRSPDLPQDYDPESSNLHTKCGVSVQVKNREFHFQEEWQAQKNHRLIQELIDEIREWVSR